MMTTDYNAPRPMLKEAVTGVAGQLGLKHADIIRVLGVSEFECARILSGRTAFSPESEAFDRIAVLFDIHRVLSRATDSIEEMKTWIHTPHETLGVAPVELMGSIHGLYQVLHLIGAQLPALKAVRLAACR